MIINNKEIAPKANLHKADLRKADLRNVNLRKADLCGADLRNANLRWADLRNVDLRNAKLHGADLNEADLCNAIGDGRVIRTIQAGKYCINISTDIMAIGCEQHSIKDWYSFNDDKIDSMDVGALAWWKVWKPIIIAMQNCD